MTALKAVSILPVFAFCWSVFAKDKPGIPLKVENESLIIVASIAGTPVHLLLDTGATLTTLPASLVPATSFKTILVHTANGDRTANLTAATITVGDQSREEVIQLIDERRSLPKGVDGILGLRTLREMCDALSIDFRKGTLICH